jgi:hypothetical protein
MVQTHGRGTFPPSQVFGSAPDAIGTKPDLFMGAGRKNTNFLLNH